MRIIHVSAALMSLPLFGSVSLARAEQASSTQAASLQPSQPVTTLTPAPVSAPTTASAMAAVVPVDQALPSIAPAGTAILRTGTELPLKLSEELTTKNKAVRVGQRFRLAVAEDVKVDGRTIIPVGSPAMGEITSVRNKGMWGKSGHIGAQLLYVQVNGRQIRLSGTFDDKGVTGTAGVVAAIAFVPIAGFFTTGTSANIPLGSGIKGFIDEDVPLSFAQSAPAPMQVAPVAQAMTIAQPASQIPALVPAAAVK